MRAAARAFAAELLASGRPRPRERPAPGARRPLAAPRPRLAHPARRPAPGRGGARAGDQGVAYRPVRGRAARLRDRGRRGDGRREPERAAEDARGAARLRPPDPAQLRARRPAGDRHLALPDGRASRRCRRRRSRSAWRRRRGDAGGERAAAARLAGGDPERAASCSSSQGRELRAAVERWAAATARRARRMRPGARCSSSPRHGGARPAERGRARVERARARPRAARPRQARRAATPRRPASAPRGAAGPRCSTSRLALLGAWFRDLAAIAEGAGELVLNADRVERARGGAGLDPRRARRAAELALDARRRLR